MRHQSQYGCCGEKQISLSLSGIGYSEGAPFESRLGCRMRYFVLFLSPPTCARTVLLNPHRGRAMAQAVSRRPPTAEGRVRSWLGLCGICGGQSGTRTGFSPSASVFPCQFHSHWCSITRKRTKIIIIFTFITGCDGPVASAAGSFLH
jgi:hypothetical protein